MRKIFGREPSVIIGFAGALVAVLAALELPWFSAGAAVAVVALITAGVTAWATRPVAPSLYVGVLTAAFALAAEYGLEWSEEGIAAAGGLVVAWFALNTVRPQVTPVIDQAPIAPANGQVR